MSKDEVTGFLRFVKYIELLPLDSGNEQYRKAIRYCSKQGLVTITPDKVCIISEKGCQLLDGKIRGAKPISLLDEELLRKDRSVKATYWIAGCATGVLLVYEFVIKAQL